MELDSRIKDGKKPLDCFDTEIAKRFIGKKGFFGTHESQFMNLDTCPKCVVDELKEVDNYDDCPFTSKGGCSYRRFLPVEWVKEPETPKFLPYTLDTWEQDFKPGDTVLFRDKEDATEYKFVYSGYIKHQNNLISVSFSPYLYTFYDLFNSYEIYRNGTWEPFGKNTKEGE